jgi:hypothetical protein
MKSIADEIYEALLEENREFEAREILKRFFKIETDKREVAEKIVGNVLSSDPRFRRTGSGKWAAVKVRTLEELSLDETPFVLFQIENTEQLVRELSAERPLSGAAYSFVLYRGGMTGENVPLGDLLKRVDSYIFVPYDSRSLTGLKVAYRIKSPLPPELKTLSVRTLCKALFPGLSLRTWDDIVREFSIVNLEGCGPYVKVQNLKGVFEHVLAAAQKRGLKQAHELLSLGVPSRKDVDFSRYGFDRERLSGLVQCPGVYTFSNREGEVIYVGKTNNLKTRINSYFWNTGESPEKIEGILKDLYMIDCTELGSDLEAMIEEFRLIEKHAPRYNTRMSIPEKKVTVPRRILVPRSFSKGMLKLYLLADGLPLLEHEYWCGTADRRLMALLEEMRAEEGYLFDPLKIIAISYMNRYEDRLIVIDVDRYRAAEDIERVLLLHCEDIKKGEREKSIYV